MFARMTAFEATDIAAIEDQLDDLAARSSAIPGQVRSEVIWTAAGKGFVVAIYETEEAANGAEEHALKIWASVLPHLAAAPVTEAYPRVRIMK